MTRERERGELGCWEEREGDLMSKFIVGDGGWWVRRGLLLNFFLESS